MKILESLFSQNYSRKLSRIIKDPKLLGSLIKEHQLTASEKLLIPKDFYVVGNSVAQLLKIILGKTSLKTAYLGCDLLQYTENFLDFGWKYEDARYCFFENHPEDSFHPYNPIDALEVEHFDVLLLGERNPNKKKQILHGIKNKKCLVIDLLEFVELFQNSLQIKKKHFNSCLNLNKLITVAFFTYLCPPTHTIIEVGSYRCGTTFMMGKLLQHMKKKNKVIAIDTFEGMPAATEKDKTGNFFYDTGMFKETSRERIETQKNKEGLQSYVQLCQGLAQDVLPQISNENRHLHFMLLDTDQYVGTMSGIKTLLSRKDSSWFALIDDTTVSGVDYAIQEALDANPWLKRKSLFHNFDLMYSDRTEFGW